MTIRPFTEKDSSTTYRVTIFVRSPENRTLSVQKKKFGIKTLSEAKKVEDKLKKDALRELVTREQQGNTWETLVNLWQGALYSGTSSSKICTTTMEDYLTALRTYTKAWNERPASSIKRFDVALLIKQMGDLGRSKTRIQCALIAINSIFRWAIDSGQVKGVEQSPATGLMVKREDGKKPEILTLAEIKRFLDLARLIEHEWYPIWATALLTGMRSGELHELQWHHVDLDGRLITICRSWNARKRIIKETKAGYWREVPINDDLLILLKELKLKSGSNEYVLPRKANWTRGKSAAVLRTFCKGSNLPSIKFHTLRACFATQLLRNNVAPAVVMKVCGWKDLKTMQYYVRLAGIEVEGATVSLQFLSPRETMGRVVELFGSKTTA